MPAAATESRLAAMCSKGVPLASAGRTHCAATLSLFRLRVKNRCVCLRRSTDQYQYQARFLDPAGAMQTRQGARAAISGGHDSDNERRAKKHDDNAERKDYQRQRPAGGARARALHGRGQGRRSSAPKHAGRLCGTSRDQPVTMSAKTFPAFLKHRQGGYRQGALLP